MSDDNRKEFEYERLIDSYHKYFELVAKGISIYVVIMGACLSLPYTLNLQQTDLALFKRASANFATVVSIGGILGYAIAGISFYFGIHHRTKFLADQLGIQRPNT